MIEGKSEKLQPAFEDLFVSLIEMRNHLQQLVAAKHGSRDNTDTRMLHF